MIDTSVLRRMQQLVESHGLSDFVLDDRPWGGEFIYRDDHLEPFLAAFFPDLAPELKPSLSTPKFLIVSPGQRFSWQYHERRGEIWRVIEGPVGLIASRTDEMTPVRTMKVGEMAEMEPRTRHRLVGLEQTGVVAELWHHASLDDPSDEQDNIRLADDYGRQGTR